MSSKREQIIQLRTENPILRLVQIADRIEVDKAYVHRILKKADLPTKSVLIARKNLPRRVICQACGEDVPKSATHAERVHHIHDECRYEYFHVLVTCRFCRAPFRRRRSILLSKWNFHKYLYCSKKCGYKGLRNDSTYDLRLNEQLKRRKIDSPDLV